MCFLCEINPEDSKRDLPKKKESKESYYDDLGNYIAEPKRPGDKRFTIESGIPNPWSLENVIRESGVLGGPTDYEVEDFRLCVRDKSEEAVNLLLKKHDDYGPNNIALSPGGPLNGLTVRLWDKVARLAHLLETGADPQNESIYDTLVDISNYGLIGMMVVDGLWPEPDLGDK